MSITKMIKLFNLCRHLFEYQEKKEHRRLPYVMARNDKTGEFVVFAREKKHADKIKRVLEKEFIDIF